MPENYSEEKYKIIQKLVEGNWNNIKLDITSWLDNGEYDILCALVCGCHFTKDLNIITNLTNILLDKITNPNTALDKDAVNIISNCYLVIKEIIWTLDDVKKEDESKKSKCEEILNKLSTNSNRYIRVYVAGVTENLDIFLNDPDKRVRKIAMIRKNVEDKPFDPKQIEFITAALESGFITQNEGYGLPTDEETMYAKFESPLFTTDTKYYAFDRDIFYNIKDQRVLAYSIIKMIESGIISFAEGMTPSYFNEGIKKLEKNKE